MSKPHSTEQRIIIVPTRMNRVRLLLGSPMLVVMTMQTSNYPGTCQMSVATNVPTLYQRLVKRLEQFRDWWWLGREKARATLAESNGKLVGTGGEAKP